MSNEKQEHSETLKKFHERRQKPGLTRALKEKDSSSSATLTEEPKQRTNGQVTNIM